MRRWILSFATSAHNASHGNVVYTSIDEPVFRGLWVHSSRMSFRAPSSRVSEIIVRSPVRARPALDCETSLARAARAHGSPHHDDVDLNIVEPVHAVHPRARDRGLAFDRHAERGERICLLSRLGSQSPLITVVRREFLQRSGRKMLPPKGVHARVSTDSLAVDDANVAQSLRFIREHACEGIEVDDVVETVPISRSVLQRLFRDLLDRSIHDEIIRVRLSRARQLLQETDLPLIEIAERAGFRHQEYMGAVFRLRLGITPGTLRMRKRRRIRATAPRSAPAPDR